MFWRDKGQKSSCKQACVRLLTFIPWYHTYSKPSMRPRRIPCRLLPGAAVYIPCQTPCSRTVCIFLQYISAAACRICFSFDLWHIVFLSGIVCFPFFSQLHTGSRNDSKTSPLAVASFHQFIHQSLCLTASFSGDNSRIAVYEERLSFLEAYQCDRKCCEQFFAVNPATTPLTPSFTSSSQSSVPVIALTCPGYKKYIRTAFECLVGSRHRLIGNQKRIIGNSIFLCLFNRKASCRCRCLKPNG